MIIFDKVFFKNFLSFGNSGITLDLKRYNTTMISGNSGSGKSTLIVEAITFGLFNKPFRKIRKGDLVNVINGGDCLVEVHFTIGERKYKVIRGIKPDIFEIVENEKLINQNPHIRDYQKYLEDVILGMSYKTWCQIVVLGYANNTPFMLLSASERRQMVDEILGIEIFQRMLLQLKEKVSNCRSELKNKDVEIETTKRTIDLQTENLEKLYSQQKSQCKELMEKVNVYTEKMETSIKEKGEFEKRLQEVENKTNDYDDIKDTLSRIKKILDTKAFQKKEKERIKDFFETNEKCPTCFQVLDNKDDVLNGINKNHHTICEEYRKAKEKFDLYSEKMENVEKLCNEVKEIINKVKILDNEITNSQNTIQTYLASIAKIENSGKEIIEDIENSNKKLKKDLEEYQRVKEEESKNLRHFLFCQNLLKEDGIKSKIIDVYLPVFTKLVNDYLEKMNFQMRIEFANDFSETIYARFRDKLSFSQLSSGEQNRISMGIILAWRKIGEMRNQVKTSILVFDEILDATLASADIQTLMEMIRSESSKDQKFFIISHKPDSISPYADNIIKIEKQGNFSKIVEGI